MIAMSAKRYKSLKYWANVGYAAKGKAYVEAFPDRKDPYYKINGEVLIDTVGEKLSECILEIQNDVEKYIKANNITEAAIAKNEIANKLIMVLLKGYAIKGKGE